MSGSVIIEMDIDRNSRHLPHPFDDDGANGDVRHEVAVHDIDMEPVGAGGFDSLDFVLESG